MCRSRQGKITIREFETSPQTTQALLAHAVDIQYDDAAVMTAAVKNLPDKVKITSTEQFSQIVGGIIIPIKVIQQHTSLLKRSKQN